MSVAVKNSNVESMLKGITIPSPPQILADLQMEMAMPDPDLDSMATLIAKDVGLSGAVLKIINSPGVGASRQVVSIQKAVMMLGISAIMDIINAISLKNATVDVDEMSNNMYATLTRFWDSAYDVAKVSEMIAEKVGNVSTSDAYMLGLFHNVGIALLIAKHDEYLDVMVDSYAQKGERIVEIENRVINTNHAVISYYTARSWKIEKRICKLIATHHNTGIFQSSNIDDSIENILLAVLKVAEHIVGLHRVLGNQETDYEWQTISENVLLTVGITSYELDDLKAQAADLGYGQQLYFK